MHRRAQLNFMGKEKHKRENGHIGPKCGMLFLALFFFLKAALCLASGEAPNTFSLSGTIFNAPNSSTPLLDSNITLRVQILDPAKTCVLYDEQQTVDTSATNGVFAIRVGSSTGAAKRIFAGSLDPSLTMANVFQNVTAMAGGGGGCGGATYTPAAGDIRYLRVIVTPNGSVADTLSPDIQLGAIPAALTAERAENLQGLARTDVLQIGTTANLTQANVENVFSVANYPILTGLLGGSLSGGFNNNSGSITNAGSITGVGANITGTGALTIAAGGAAQDLTLLSSTTGSVNIGSGNGESLGVLDGGPATVNYLTVDGSAAAARPILAAAGSDADIGITITPKGTGNTIFSSGNVGIGTTSPSQALDVNGMINSSNLSAIYTTGTFVAGNIGLWAKIAEFDLASYSDSLATKIDIVAGTSTQAQAATAELFFRVKSQNIGPTAPYISLYVNYATAPLGKLDFATYADPAPVGAYAKIQLWAKMEQDWDIYSVQAHDTFINNSVSSALSSFTVFNNPALQAAPPVGYLTTKIFNGLNFNNGYVGIGTTNPAQDLSVVGTGISTNITANNPGASTAAYPGYDVSNYTNGQGGYSRNRAILYNGTAAAPAAAGASQIILNLQGWGVGTTISNIAAGITFLASAVFTDASSPGYITFSTTPAPTIALAERMRLDASGNVGIGSNAPTSLLNTKETTARTASYTGVLHSISNTSGTAAINKIGMDIESTGLWNGASAVNTGLIVNATGGTTNYAATFSGGNVGVGLSTPSQALDVIGTVNASNGITVSGTPAGTSSASFWNASGSNLFYRAGNATVGTSLIVTPTTISITAATTYTSGSALATGGKGIVFLNPDGLGNWAVTLNCINAGASPVVGQLLTIIFNTNLAADTANPFLTVNHNTACGGANEKTIYTHTLAALTGTTSLSHAALQLIYDGTRWLSIAPISP